MAEEHKGDAGASAQATEELKVEFTISDSGPCEKTITLTAPAELLAKRYAESLDEMCATVALPGFRRGKAPRNLVERQVADTIKDHLKARFLNEGLEEALKEIEIVGEPVLPDVASMTFDPEKPLVYEVKVEILPEVKVENYTGIPVERRQVVITDEDVERELQTWLRRFGRLVPLPQGHVERENYAVADVELYEGDKMVWSANAQPLDLVNNLVAFMPYPGLADQVVGMRLNEEKQLGPVTLDDEFPVEDLRGKTVTPKLKIVEVRKLWVPPLTDETAKNAGFDSLDELKGFFRKSLEQRRDDLGKEQLRRQIAEYILAKNVLPLPARLVQRQTDENIRRSQVNLLRQGFSMQDLTQMQDRIVEASKRSAESGLRLSLFLRYIGDQEKIYAPESQVDEHIRQLAARENLSEANMRRALEKYDLLRTIRSSLREDNVYDWLISKAEIKDVQATAEAGPDAK